jgi:pimeloyl-ACP methyl ester carboxylesterase
LATVAIKAPNQQQKPRVATDAAYAATFDGLAAQRWMLPVGPPTAKLAVEVVEPGNYQFKYAVEPKQNEQGYHWLEPKFEVTMPAAPLPAKGTVIVLHGYRDTWENTMHWALCLAEVGYRCVLVDLRGHGRSTGDTIGYGAFEVPDLVQVIDDLQKRGLTADRVGLLGVSYGASMSLLLAARDHRVATVVALEPFSNAAKALVEFARGVAPQQAAQISAASFSAAVSKASARGKFSWSDGDVLAAMDQITAPVLFFHGAKDTWISPDHSRALQARAKGVSRLVILPEDDHVFLSMRLGAIGPDVRGWFDTYLAPSAL